MEDSQRCQSPWAGPWIYVYCVITILLAIIGFVGMMTAAYNRSESTKRRVYSNRL